MDSQIAWLKHYIKNVWVLIKRELQKENISKRNILINRIKEIYENIPYKYIQNIVESFVTRLQRSIDLEGNRTGY